MDSLDVSQMVSTISTKVDTDGEFTGTVPREVCNRLRKMDFIVICRDYVTANYTICKDYKPLHTRPKKVEKQFTQYILNHKLPEAVVEHYYYKKNIFIQQTQLNDGYWDCCLIKKNFSYDNDKQKNTHYTSEDYVADPEEDEAEVDEAAAEVDVEA